MYIPNLSVVCFFICLSYFIFYCALLLFCAQAWHGKTLSSRINPIFFCSLHWRNLSLYNKITTTHFKQIRFWWKNVIKFRGKVYSNFFKFVQQLFFLSVTKEWLHHNSVTVLEWPSQSWIQPNWASLERPKNGCPPMFTIQPDRTGEDLQGGMAEDPQIQVWKTCCIFPKKTHGCIKSKGCFY